MELVRLVFANGNSLYDKLTKIRQRSKWSHVGIVIDNVVYESVYPKGIVKTNITEFIKRYGEENVEFSRAYASRNWRNRANMYLGYPHSITHTLLLSHCHCWARSDKWSSNDYVAFIMGTFRTWEVPTISIDQLWISSQ